MRKYLFVPVIMMFITSCAEMHLGTMAILGEEDSVAALGDRMPEYKEYVASIKDMPAPTWRIPVEYDNADIFQWVSKDRLLVGWLQYRGLRVTTVAPQHKALVLYDTREGKELWRYDREDISEKFGQYALVHNGSAFVIKQAVKNTITWIALDINTGKETWRRTWQGTQYKVDVPGKLIVTYRKGDSVLIEQLDATNGKTKWSSKYVSNRKSASDRQIFTYLKTSLFMTDGYNVIAINLNNGKIKWKKALNKSGPFRNLLLSGNKLILQGENTLALLNTSGNVLWQKSLSSAIKLVDSDKNRIYILYNTHYKSDKKRGFNITALNVKNAKQLWNKSYKGRHRSAFIIGKDLGLSTDKAYLSLSTKTGKLKSRIKLSEKHALDAFEELDSLLPDIIRSKGGKLYLARENNGVIAINTKSARIVWSNKKLEYDGGHEFTFKWAKQELPESIKPEATSVKVNYSSKSLSNQSYSYFDVALSDYTRRRNEASPIKDYEYDMYQQSMKTGLSLDEMQMQLGRSTALAQAGVMAVNAAAFATYARMDERKQIGEVNHSTQQLRLVREKHFSALRDDYYFKAFSVRDLKGITAIRLKDGRRYDIVVSPQLDITGGKILDQYISSNDGKQVVAIGSGMDAEKFVTRTRRGTTMPQFALLGYKLSGSSFMAGNKLEKRAKKLDFYGWNSDLFKPVSDPGYVSECYFSSLEDKKAGAFLKKNINYKDCKFHAFIGNVVYDNKATVDFIYKNGLDINNIRSEAGMSLLGRIAQKQDVENLRKFLDVYKPDPEIKFDFGNLKSINILEFCGRDYLCGTDWKVKLAMLKEYERTWN